jgi:hypothetical protein
MFAAVISATLIGVLYNIFYATTQQSHKVGAKYQAMQSSLTASEILSREIDRLITLPVQKDDQGFVVARYGDHGRPLRLAEDQRGISFYVPGELGDDLAVQSAIPLTLNLVPGATPGTFVLKRSTRGVEEAGAGGAEEESLQEGDRLYRGVLLRSLKFRVLSPDAEQAAVRSPDDNFYLEAVIVGTDRDGKEESPLSILKPLTFPSERRFDPSISAVSYAPEAPLVPPSVAVNPTPAEKKAAEDLTKLADDWRNGTISNEDLVKKAREALSPIAGTTPTGPITSLRPKVAPIPPGAVVLTPKESGVPVIGPPPGTPGPRTVLPPAPGAPKPAPPGPRWGNGKGEFVMKGWIKKFDSNGKEIASGGFEAGGTNDGNMSIDELDSALDKNMDDMYTQFVNATR